MIYARRNWTRSQVSGMEPEAVPEVPVPEEPVSAPAASGGESLPEFVVTLPKYSNYDVERAVGAEVSSVLSEFEDSDMKIYHIPSDDDWDDDYGPGLVRRVFFRIFVLCVVLMAFTAAWLFNGIMRDIHENRPFDVIFSNPDNSWGKISDKYSGEDGEYYLVFSGTSVLDEETGEPLYDGEYEVSEAIYMRAVLGDSARFDARIYPAGNGEISALYLRRPAEILEIGEYYIKLECHDTAVSREVDFLLADSVDIGGFKTGDSVFYDEAAETGKDGRHIITAMEAV